MTKSVARPGVTAKALHHIKKMYSTISSLSTADLAAGHYDRVHTMWANYFKELNVTLEKPNKGYIKLAGKLRDVLWLRSVGNFYGTDGRKKDELKIIICK